MTTPTLDAKVHDFLAQKRIAVAGGSRDGGRHPVGNVIFRRLKTTGHAVFAGNPNMQTFEGDRCVYCAGVDFPHTCMRWVLRLTGSLPA